MQRDSLFLASLLGAFLMYGAWIWRIESTSADEPGGASASSVKAQNASASALPADPAFDKYVDLQLLRRAWRDLDAPLLTDVALQLAEAESRLKRSHKAISADRLFAVAIRVAARYGHRATLLRLQRAVAKRSPALQSQVATQLNLPGTSRLIVTGKPSVSAATSEAALATLQAVWKRVERAELTANVAELERIRKELRNNSALGADQVKQLEREIDQARKRLAEEPRGKELNAALATLNALSRGRTCWKCSGTGRYIRGLRTVRCDRCGGDGRITNEGIKRHQATSDPNGAVITGATTRPWPDRKDPKLNAWVRYSLRNDSEYTVQVRMKPSGKTYTLRPGYYSSSFRSRMIVGKRPTITVFSGPRTRTYVLRNNRRYRLYYSKSLGRIAFTSY